MHIICHLFILYSWLYNKQFAGYTRQLFLHLQGITPSSSEWLLCAKLNENPEKNSGI